MDADADARIAECVVVNVQHRLPARVQRIETAKRRRPTAKRIQQTHRLQHGLTDRLDNQARSDRRRFRQLVIDRDVMTGSRQKRRDAQTGNTRACNRDVHGLHMNARPFRRRSYVRLSFMNSPARPKSMEPL